MVLPSGEQLGYRHCDADYHHPPAEVNWWIPLTSVHSSNSLLTESSPGKGDFRSVEMEYGQALRQILIFIVKLFLLILSIIQVLREPLLSLYCAKHNRFNSSIFRPESLVSGAPRPPVERQAGPGLSVQGRSLLQRSLTN